jgi:HSP20 family molecular chaperone IbpA
MRIKNTILAILLTVTAQLSAESPIGFDQFSQIDKMFNMQMKQMEQIQQHMDKMVNAMVNIFESNSVNLPSSNNFISFGSGLDITTSQIQDRGKYYELTLKNANAENSTIKVDAKDGVLKVSVNSKVEIEKNTSNGIVKSYSSSSFMQTFRLPADADSSSIDYDLKGKDIIIKIPKKSK